MYYFAIITSDFCPQAEMSLTSFFNYNDVTLHLFVVDSGYDKVKKHFSDKWYFDKLDIINYYSEDFNQAISKLQHAQIAEKDFPTSTRLSTLNRFRIFDDVKENELTSIDLDVMYFGKIDFSNYQGAMNGSHEPSLNLAKPFHEIDFLINAGVCKYIKDKFNVKTSFTEEMFNRLQNDGPHYWLPDQDILNELATCKCAISEAILTRSMPYTPYLRIRALHYTTPFFKPWVIHPELQIQNQPERILALGFLLYQRYAKRSKIFLKEADTNVAGLLKNSKDSVNFTIAANKIEFRRLCTEIDSWKI